MENREWRNKEREIQHHHNLREREKNRKNISMRFICGIVYCIGICAWAEMLCTIDPALSCAFLYAYLEQPYALFSHPICCSVPSFVVAFRSFQMPYKSVFERIRHTGDLLHNIYVLAVFVSSIMPSPITHCGPSKILMTTTARPSHQRWYWYRVAGTRKCYELGSLCGKYNIGFSHY